MESNTETKGNPLNKNFLTESKEFFIKKTFELNNVDGSGFVSLEEAYKILRDLGQNIDESEYNGLIAQATNTEGKIDYVGLKQVILRRIAEFLEENK